MNTPALFSQLPPKMASHSAVERGGALVEELVDALLKDGLAGDATGGVGAAATPAWPGAGFSTAKDRPGSSSGFAIGAACMDAAFSAASSRLCRSSCDERSAMRESVSAKRVHR